MSNQLSFTLNFNQHITKPRVWPLMLTEIILSYWKKVSEPFFFFWRWKEYSPVITYFLHNSSKIVNLNKI